MGWWKWKSGTVLAASLLLQQGCLIKKTPRKASIVIPPTVQPGPPQMIPMPPQLPAPSVTPPQQAAKEIPTLPPPAQPSKPVRPRTARRPTPGVPGLNPPPVETAPPVPMVASPPTLQPILGSQETVERNRRINQYLDKTRGVIARAERANPSFGDRELIAQVRTFVQQAEEARRVDLVRAENLAERAEVLSRALVK